VERARQEATAERAEAANHKFRPLRALRSLRLLVVGWLAWAAIVGAQPDPKTALLERAGWNALVAGRARDAADAFREALAADPRNARLHVGAGTAAFLERRDSDARQALELALTLDPRLTRARALLGQVFYRSGDLPAAIGTYETLIAEAPDDKQARATLDRWRREAELNERLHQTVGSHFTVSFEGPEEAPLAEKALDALERAYWRIADTLSAYPLAAIPVVLYSNEQFRDITRSPSWAAGAYDGTIRVPMRGALADPEELDRVLAHEFTHALVRGIAPRGVPTWLNEGLATALERGDLSWAERRVRDARGRVELSALTGSFGRLTGAQAQLAYAASALAVRKLIEDAGGFAIANLLRDLGDGVSFDAAFAHRMQRSFSDFQASVVVF